jgi:hypothetical protein
MSQYGKSLWSEVARQDCPLEAALWPGWTVHWMSCRHLAQPRPRLAVWFTENNLWTEREEFAVGHARLDKHLKPAV